jgi:hypothetical protein
VIGGKKMVRAKGLIDAARGDEDGWEACVGLSALVIGNDRET